MVWFILLCMNRSYSHEGWDIEELDASKESSPCAIIIYTVLTTAQHAAAILFVGMYIYRFINELMHDGERSLSTMFDTNDILMLLPVHL